ncbi:MAG: transglutaminase family protein [Planctomycetaceae bacterium]|nr:transglutaminase family protein [Planctomycetaceae bacterium]
MSIWVAINHKTQYTYDQLVTLQPHVIRLRPAPHCRTPIIAYALRALPQPHFLNWQQDPYSNYLARLVFPKPAREFSVEVDLIAEMTAINPFDFFIDSSAETSPFAYEPALAHELAPYLATLPAGPKLQELAESLRQHDVRTIDYLVDINGRIKHEIDYTIRMEPGVQTCEETLTKKNGSCRDSAWLLVQTLRHLGMAARFVSGYLIQLVADVEALDGPPGPTHDFTDLHAWSEVYIPGAGWIGLDPTSGLLVSEGHIPLACAADPTNAAAISGSYSFTSATSSAGVDECHEEFDFSMSVTRVRELPRVTKPYTDEQWRRIDALGDRVDQRLRELDVRLTMGGEPTFVSIDDRDGDEWNIAALGPAKAQQADVLLKRLQEKFAPGALLHYGQGKWYPGEPLPRWAYGCYWRRDGHAFWNDLTLVADLDQDYGVDADDARQFITVLTNRLGIDPVRAIPAYEDTWYYLWRERKLPTNVDPLKNRLDNAEERLRLTRLFEQGLDKIVGYALPLRRDPGPAGGWESGPWRLRQEHLFLLPGDSPMGYRLPLDSLPWEPEAERHALYEQDPFAPREPLALRPLPGHDRRISSSPPAALPALNVAATNGVARHFDTPHETPSLVRTALCVEPREGRLHIFMPPVESLDDYVDLITAVEQTAAALQIPVLIEGYKPPSDPRMNSFQITPDPGVIEVNTQPARSWRELVEITTTLYDEARASRLCTEKFQLDGRHIGTGGGNHMVIGGPTPADSPILRRPDLLRSLLTCWHNHPSLSYLFSSLFVGPTSQAPRVDEARNDSVYEMEIAFRQIPDAGECVPWLVDRVFRHLLTDVSGNTHRAEFCIDKLFSPDSSDGRRGLVELRAFEMPPHARMSLVQQLLLRALIARFWENPNRQKLARWGTQLHDRFLLPHFIEQDFEDLLDELAQAGYPLQKEWFAPHLEFRFPRLGTITQRGLQIELRTAIEPWHVLGEEQGSGGTARYVDWSVERLQVKVQGLVDTRHLVTCNGVGVPLFPTGTIGEYVAGVRYRAWQPPSCLHPTLGIDAPLVFDLHDTWSGRAIGGCQYHVTHPGGRSFDTFPVNAAEAEGRRQARFFAYGHSPGPAPVTKLEINPEFPLTLDLRKSLKAPLKPAEASPIARWSPPVKASDILESV